MSQICSTASRLVKESSNSQIISISSNLIDEVCEDIKRDYKLFVSQLEKNDEINRVNNKDHESSVNGENLSCFSYNQILLFDKINRNKRGVLIYLNERIKKLKNLSWQYFNNLPDDVSNISFTESDTIFYNQYTKNLQDYFNSLAIDNYNEFKVYNNMNTYMDLSKSLAPPMTDNIIVSVKAEENIKDFKLDKFFNSYFNYNSDGKIPEKNVTTDVNSIIDNYTNNSNSKNKSNIENNKNLLNKIDLNNDKCYKIEKGNTYSFPFSEIEPYIHRGLFSINE